VAFAVLFAIAALLGWPPPGLAQSQLSPGAMLMRVQASSSTPATLIGIAVREEAPGQARVLLTFASHAPAFSVVTAEGDRPSIMLVATSRGATARAPPPNRLFRTVEFEQRGADLFVRVGASTPVTLAAGAVGDQTISLSLTTGEGGIAADAAGELPKAEDRPPEQDGFEVVPLKYADVSEVVGLLTQGLSIKSNDVFTPIEPAFGSPGSAAGAPPPQFPGNTTTSDQPLAQSVDSAIGIDRRLNAIVLTGTPATIARLKAKIAEIDVPVQSVILETMFVELDESGASNIGLNFNNSNSQIGVATFQSGAFAASGGDSEKIVSSVSLQAAISAEVQKGHGKIVSKPRIAAQSGSTAKIITGDALPILTSIALSGVNAVSQQVQYVNVGVTLQIAPRISVDGFVTSHVFCVVSSVTGTSQGYPTISQREAETSATVRDGETFVIGGLTVDSDLSTDSKVPALGDVPGLGQLFHNRTDTRSKTDLYIVVTPRIIRRDDIGLALNRREAAPAATNPTPAPASQTAATPALEMPPQAAVAEATTAEAAEPAAITPPTTDGRSAGNPLLRPTLSPGAAPAIRRTDAPMTVQIGAYATSSLAEKALDDTQQAMPQLMTDKTRKVVAITRSGKRYYRALVGGFVSRDDAWGFCGGLKTVGRPCFISGGERRSEHVS
jgi:general secretion pathway protein D